MLLVRISSHIRSRLGQGNPKIFSYYPLAVQYFIASKYHKTRKTQEFLKSSEVKGSGRACCLAGLYLRQGLKAGQGQSPLARDRAMRTAGRE